MPKSIILVEDDTVILQNATAILEDAGLSVVPFSNADDALIHVFERDGDVAAVFADVQMPGQIDGLVLAEIVGRHWPKVAVILTSGRVRPMQALPQNTQFISKPWRVSQVLAALAV